MRKFSLPGMTKEDFDMENRMVTLIVADYLGFITK
jgi:hypothetical protein